MLANVPHFWRQWIRIGGCLLHYLRFHSSPRWRRFPALGHCSDWRSGTREDALRMRVTVNAGTLQVKRGEMNGRMDAPWNKSIKGMPHCSTTRKHPPICVPEMPIRRRGGGDVSVCAIFNQLIISQPQHMNASARVLPSYRLRVKKYSWTVEALYLRFPWKALIT